MTLLSVLILVAIAWGFFFRHNLPVMISAVRKLENANHATGLTAGEYAWVWSLIIGMFIAMTTVLTLAYLLGQAIVGA